MEHMRLSLARTEEGKVVSFLVLIHYGSRADIACSLQLRCCLYMSGQAICTVPLHGLMLPCLSYACPAAKPSAIAYVP